ncbi:C40 family peptidase [Bernardetia sp.]|uniref:C40 family peptidase n=1 Tax=Bernardetia sp. TaxID=1937974 RepID=UPI0025C37F5C|nr:C40 family peptidase [Bernardetia sp.]
MDLKHYPLVFIFASIIFSSFTTGKPAKPSTTKRKNTHGLIFSSTTSNSSVSSTSYLNCFQTPFDFIPTFNLPIEKDTLKNKVQSAELDILSLLDEEASQKTNPQNIESDINNTVYFPSPNNITVAPHILEKIIEREEFTNSLVDIAIQQEGVPYVYGGKSPNGFDCSGFVSYVYGQFNINLPSSSRSYEYVGREITLEEVQVGDILCFTGRNARSGRTGHVGIVVENNPDEPIKFIHAASGSRRQITYSTMESSYYKPRFRSARRISMPIIEDILEESVEETE